MRANTMRMMQTAALVFGLASGAALAAPPTAGLQAWYKADTGVTTDGNGNVSQWDDQSSNGKNATQSTANLRPALSSATMPIGSSMAVVQYHNNNSDGSYDQLDLPSVSQDGGSGATVYFVVNDDAETLYTSVKNWLNRSYTGGEPAIYGKASDYTKIGMYFDAWTAEAAVQSGWKVARFMWDGSGSSTLVTNYSTKAGALATSVSIPSKTGNWVSLGVSGYGQHTFASFAEVLIYNRALDATERAQVETYLKERYYPTVEPGYTAADVTWAGGAGSGNPAWNVTTNWLDSEIPTTSTAATVYFKTNGQDVVGILETDRQVGKITVGDGATVIAHTLDLGTHTLTVAGDVVAPHGSQATLTVTNGTLQVGTGTTAGNITFGAYVNKLTVSPGAQLDAAHVGSITIGYPGWGDAGNSILDLRGASVAGGTLAVSNLLVRTGVVAGSYLYLDAGTSVTSLWVKQTLTIGEAYGGGYCYIGNPGDSGRLPPNVSIRVGTDAANRGDMTVGYATAYTRSTDIKLVASGGGTFTAYVTNLWVMRYEMIETRNDQSIYATMDLRAMDRCTIDAGAIKIALDRTATAPDAIDNQHGALYLPQGTVTAGVVQIGATVGLGGYGLLTTSNTLLTVTNTLTLNKTAVVTNAIGAVSSGFDIANPDAGALAVDAAARLTVRFIEPAAAKPHVGLRWKGDHTAALNAMIGDGRLVVDDAGLGKSALVYVKGGYTGIGLPPPQGTMIFLR